MTDTTTDGKAERSPVALAEEMRDPLTAILNAVHALALSRDEAAAKRVRGVVARQVERLSALADELQESLEGVERTWSVRRRPTSAAGEKSHVPKVSAKAFDVERFPRPNPRAVDGGPVLNASDPGN